MPRRTRHHHNAVRRRRVLMVFIDILQSWRSLIHSAQQIIGNGEYEEFQSLPEMLLDGGENITNDQLRNIDREIKELEEMMHEILIHAKTRLYNDAE